jgi:hypothetical protein
MYAGRNRILYHRANESPQILLDLCIDSQIVGLTLSPDGTLLSTSIFDDERNFVVAIINLSERIIIHELEVSSMPIQTLWIDDDNLSLSIENENNFLLELFIYNLSTETFTVFDSPPINIYPIVVTELIIDPDTECQKRRLEIIAFNDLRLCRRTLGKTTFIERTSPHVIEEMEIHYFNRWLTARPSLRLPENIIPHEYLTQRRHRPLREIRYRAGLVIPWTSWAMGQAVFSDPLGQHVVQGSAWIPFNMDNQDNRPFYVLTYMNRTFRPTIIVNMLQTKWIAGMHREDPNINMENIFDFDFIYNWLRSYSLTAMMPYNFGHRQFRTATISLGLTYHEFELARESWQFYDMFTSTRLVIANIAGRYQYNLPWRSDLFHPVRQLNLNLSFDYASERLGMIQDYSHLHANMSFAFAPFLNILSDDRFSISNNTTYRLVNKNETILQFLPGVDDSKFIVGTNRMPLFTRMYQRGFHEQMWGRELFSTQTDLNFKLADVPLFLGGSLWLDYTYLSSIYRIGREKQETDITSREFLSAGWELRAGFNLFGIPTLHRFGQAWCPRNQRRLDTYYMIGVPFSF